MLSQVLIPLDGSALAERILPYLVALLKGMDSSVSLLRVVDPQGRGTQDGSVDPFAWQIRKAEAESYLKDIASRLESAGLSTSTYILEGKAADSVIEFAHDQKIPVIALTSHGQSGISGWNVSSVVQKVILRASRSIFLVRSYLPEPADSNGLSYKRIMVPLDGSQRAENVLPVVQKIAEQHESEILLVHVVEEPEMPRRTPLSDEDVELANRVIERNRVEASRYFDELKSRLSGDIDTRLLVSRSAHSALHQIAEQSQVDLVILSAHGYSGEAKWHYGSTVVSFLAYGTTPLLVVQDLPEDQIEPTQAEMVAREHGGR